jgi:hypothetical protein
MTEIKPRRSILKAGLGTGLGAAAIGIAVASSGAHAQEKLAPTAVQYQDHPKDGAICSRCVNFQPPNACTIVSGVISPNGWCIAYAPKAS